MKSIFSYHLGEAVFWFRMFNSFGVHVRNKNKTMTLFSERNGYQKFMDIGKYRFKILK